MCACSFFCDRVSVSVALRLCLFIASFLLVAIIVFINRLYFEPNN